MFSSRAVSVERCLADAGVNDTSLFDAELDSAALGCLDGTGDVHGDGSDLRVRHHAARAENLTETADERHHVRGRDAAIEIDLAALNDFDQVFRTDDVGTGSLGFISLGTTCEDGDANRRGLCRSAG